jgi:hypothetical protein
MHLKSGSVLTYRRRSSGSTPPAARVCVLILYVCAHATHYVCVLMLSGQGDAPAAPICVLILYMCPHLTMCPHAIYVSSYYYICVLVLSEGGAAPAAPPPTRI